MKQTKENINKSSVCFSVDVPNWEAYEPPINHGLFGALRNKYEFNGMRLGRCSKKIIMIHSFDNFR